MTAIEAREISFKINPQSPELTKEEFIDKVLPLALESIKKHSLLGEYNCILSFIDYTEDIGIRLEDLGYNIKISTNQYTGSDYVRISW